MIRVHEKKKNQKKVLQMNRAKIEPCSETTASKYGDSK